MAVKTGVRAYLTMSRVQRTWVLVEESEYAVVHRRLAAPVDDETAALDEVRRLGYDVNWESTPRGRWSGRRGDHGRWAATAVGRAGTNASAAS